LPVPVLLWLGALLLFILVFPLGTLLLVPPLVLRLLGVLLLFPVLVLRLLSALLLFVLLLRLSLFPLRGPVVLLALVRLCLLFRLALFFGLVFLLCIAKSGCCEKHQQEKSCADNPNSYCESCEFLLNRTHVTPPSF
jgi:hypothetical protein